MQEVLGRDTNFEQKGHEETQTHSRGSIPSSREGEQTLDQTTLSLFMHWKILDAHATLNEMAPPLTVQPGQA